MKLVNTNEHRIYRGDDVIRAGAVFEGNAEDAKRPGIAKLSDLDENDRPAEAEADGEVESVTAKHAEEVADLARAAARKGHEQLREAVDDRGHAIPGSADQPSPGTLPPERPPAERGTTAPLPEGEDGEDDLDELKKSELQAVAEREGVEFSKRDTNDELIAAIRKHRAG